ncbi:MAG: type VI secretion system membrane subunit TssM, partial [Rhodospirillaceae bacterium]
GIMVAWGLINQLRQLRERQASTELADALTMSPPDGDEGDEGDDSDDNSDDNGNGYAAPLVQPSSFQPSSVLDALSVPEHLICDAKPGDAEIQVLRQNLTDAVGSYRRRCGQHSLRRLPWYLVIGAPGAGKTTALANSALTFPLSDILGHHPVQGVAGTRSCDWWFTSDAVLVDTAGRYTSQDSDHEADGAAWLGLLDLLRRHRPVRPINGVVVAVSLEDIATLGLVARHHISELLSQRLSDIELRIGIRLPVYVLLTKADRLTGFSEFFATLTDKERGQVWGITFDAGVTGVTGGTGGGAAGVGWSGLFSSHFDRLMTRLEQRALERLAEEPDPGRRALIAGFPLQMASMRSDLADFLTHAVRPPSPSSRLMLRGVYLTSAKRDGVPFDRMAAEVTSSFGLARPDVAGPESDSEIPRYVHVPDHTFFLSRLFREVVIPESHLAGDPDGGLALRQRWRHWAAMALLAAMMAVSALWSRSWLVEHRQLAALNADLGRIAGLMPDGLGGGSYKDEVVDGNVEAVLPALDALRSIRSKLNYVSEKTGSEKVESERAESEQSGLDQSDQIGRLANTLYQRALRRLLLPRLIVRLETAMARPTDSPNALTPDRLYDALRVYLMLDGEGPLDRYVITRWFTVELIATLPGPAKEPDRHHLTDHLTALLETGMPGAQGSVAVEADVRRRLSNYALDERGYAMLRGIPAVRGLSDWHLLDQIGPDAGLVLVRNSGRSLTEPMPGLYTAEGAHRIVLPAIGRIATEIALESWVLGLAMDPASVSGRARQLRRNITARYFTDYARQWQEFLADLSIAPVGTTPQLLALMAAAAGPASPLPPLVAAVLHETKVTPPVPSWGGAKAGKPGMTTPGMLGLPTQGTIVATVQSPNSDDDPASWWPTAMEIGMRFKTLQAVAQPVSERAQAPLTTAMANLTGLHKALARWTMLPQARPGASRTPTSREERAASREAQTKSREALADVRRATDRVKEAAAGLPAPLSGWFAGLAEAGGRVLLAGPGTPP